MKKLYQGALSRLILLLLTLSILLSSLSGCYVADNKSEIQDNLDATLQPADYTYVYEYLREWGMPIFDTIKFQHFESCFIQKYNFNEMPDTLTHAKDTAQIFLDEYYDEINLKDKSSVTDSLLRCYISLLGDAYSTYRPAVETEEFLTDMSGKFGGIGVMVEYNDNDESIMVNTVYPDSPAEKAGVKVGDFIHAVDGKTVDELGYHNAVYYVRGEIGTDVTLTLLRGETLVTVTATRAEVEEINAQGWIIPDTNLGYVQIVSFKDNTFNQFKAAVDSLVASNVDGIVFDLRGNPGGYVESVIDVISYLIPDGQVVMSFQYKNEDPVFKYAKDDIGEDHKLDLPFTVICNQYTASAGEIFTAAMRDYTKNGLVNATIVGTTTYGKGIMQNTYSYLFDGSSVTMTVAFYNPPNGVNYHGIGVVPDRTVELDDSGEDNQLSAAIEELQKLIIDN